MKTVGVLFSGGLDSTYLLWKNLKSGNKVYPIYVEIGNNSYKTELELNRIKLIYNYLKNDFGDLLYDIHYSYEINMNVRENSLHLRQVPLWILSLIYSQDLPVEKFEIGYVLGDDAISHLKEIKKIYNSFEGISEKLKPIKFPLIKEHKCSIASEMPKNIVELTITCENPMLNQKTLENTCIEFEPCCECPGCYKIINSEFYGLNLPKNYEKVLISKHGNFLRNLNYKVLDEKGNDVNEMQSTFSKEPVQLEFDFK